MNKGQVNELLYQALETELGGVQIYTKALTCAVNPDLIGYRSRNGNSGSQSGAAH